MNMIASMELENGRIINLMFFTHVQNEKFIVEKVRNVVYPFSVCAIVNSKLILGPFQIFVAANKAVVAKRTGTMKTKTLPTELLFNLSMSDNINDSLREFGYDANPDHEILFVVFSDDNKRLFHIFSDVLGIMRPISALGQTNDINLIKKAYDVTEEQLTTNSLLHLIVTKIACKSV